MSHAGHALFAFIVAAAMSLVIFEATWRAGKRLGISEIPRVALSVGAGVVAAEVCMRLLL